MSKFLSQRGGLLTARGSVSRSIQWPSVSLAALAACCLLVRWCGAAEPEAAPAPSDARRSEIQQVYSALPDKSLGGLLADDAFAIERQIGHAMKIDSERHTEDFFDLERAYSEVQARSARTDELASPEVLAGFKKGLTANFAANPMFKRFRKLELKRVKRLESDDEALAYAAHRDEDGTGVKMRWWLRKSQGRWRIYDFEDLDGGIRFSTGFSLAFDSLIGKQPDPRIQPALQAMATAARLFIAKRFDEAEPLLRSTSGAPLPAPLAALRDMELGALLVMRGQFAEALTHLDRALELQADMPAAVLLHGTCYNGLGRYAEALPYGRRYIDMLGSDDAGYLMIGISLANLGHTDEAIAAFRLGLDDYSDSVENLVSLAEVLPPDRLREAADRFAAFKRPTFHFEEIADRLRSEGFPAALLAIVERHRAIAPNDARNDYFAGEAHFQQGEYQKAADAFRQAIERANDRQRPGYVSALVGTLLSANQPRQAYEANPNPTGFYQVANYLIKDDRVDEAEEICKLHERHFADDPWLTYFRAEALIIRRQFAEAAALFEPLLGQALPDDLRGKCLSEYLLTMHSLGKALEAYRAVPDDAALAFRRLGDRLIRARNAEVLEQLIAAHAERLPDDGWLPYYRGRLLLARDQAGEAATLLKPLLAGKSGGAIDPELWQALSNACFDAVLAGEGPLPAYVAAPDAETAFYKAANQLSGRRDSDSLDKLCDAHDARHPGLPETQLYRSHARYYRGDFLAAAALVAPLSERMHLAGDDHYLESYLECMLQAGEPLAGYRVACDAKLAFKYLAAEMTNSSQLDQLIAAHEPEHGDDVWLTYYKARRLADDDRSDAAMRLLRTAFARLPDDAKQRFTQFYVRELERRGRYLEAYRTAPDQELAFQWLSQWLSGNLNNVPEFSRLLRARTEDAPDDKWLPYYRGKLLNLKGRHEEAAAEFEPLLAATDEQLRDSAFDEYATACLAAGKALELYEHASDRNAAFRRAAWNLSDGKRPDELAALITLHHERYPDDRWPTYYQGHSLFAQGRYQEAAAIVRPLLDDESDASLQWTTRSLLFDALLKAGQLEQAYQDAPNKAVAFASLAEKLSSEIAAADPAIASQAREGLERLLGWHERTGPDAMGVAELAHYRARLHEARGEIEQAAHVLQQAIAGLEKLSGAADDGADGDRTGDNQANDNQANGDEPDGDEADDGEDERAYEKEELANELHELWMRADQPLKAYESAPSMFYGVAYTLFEKRDGERLRQLIAAHRSREPNAPWLDYYAAKERCLAGAYDDADRALDAGLAKSPPDYVRSAYLRERLEIALAAGRAADAYTASDNHERTFSALWALCRDAGNAAAEGTNGVDSNAAESSRRGEALERIVALRRAEAPDEESVLIDDVTVPPLRRDFDESLLAADVDAAFLRRDYTAAADRLLREREMLGPLRSADCDRRLVLARIKLGHFDEALTLARQLADDENDYLPLARVRAAAGDRADVEAALEQCLADAPARLPSLYQDEILAPLLAGDAYAAFRKKHPRPAPTPGELR